MRANAATLTDIGTVNRNALKLVSRACAPTGPSLPFAAMNACISYAHHSEISIRIATPSTSPQPKNMRSDKAGHVFLWKLVIRQENSTVSALN